MDMDIKMDMNRDMNMSMDTNMDMDVHKNMDMNMSSDRDHGQKIAHTFWRNSIQLEFLIVKNFRKKQQRRSKLFAVIYIGESILFNTGSFPHIVYSRELLFVLYFCMQNSLLSLVWRVIIPHIV
jgi:hypothetical protein